MASYQSEVAFLVGVRLVFLSRADLLDLLKTIWQAVDALPLLGFLFVARWGWFWLPRNAA